MTPLRSHCSLLVFGYQLVSVSNMVTVPFLSQTVQELFCSPPPFFFFAKEKVLCFDYCSESYIERPDSPAKIISENLYFSFSFSFFLTTYCLFSFLPYAKRQAPLFLFQKQKMQLKSKSVTSLYSFFFSFILIIYYFDLLPPQPILTEFSTCISPKPNMNLDLLYGSWSYFFCQVNI